MINIKNKIVALVAIFVSLLTFRTQIVEAVEMITGCPNIHDNGVTLFEGKYCSGDRVNFDAPGSYLLENFSFSQLASSDYVKWGWSVRVSDGENSVCHNWAAWDFSKDTYHEGSSVNDSATNIEVYDAPNCATPTNPTPTPSTITGCPSITDNVVTVFEHAYCSGNSKNYTSTGVFDLSEKYFNNLVSSVHVQPGWSVKLTNEDQTICKEYSAWNFAIDSWPNATSMNDTLDTIEVFSSPGCDDSAAASTPSPTPEPTPSTNETKLLVLNFVPDSVTPVYNPSDLTNQIIPVMKDVSGGKVDYKVVDEQTVNRSTIKRSDGRMDYGALISEFRLCSRLNSGDIDEVWVWVNGADGAGWEWIISGSVNYPEPMLQCEKDLLIMGFDYTRTYDLALHSLGHRMEYLANYANGPEYRDWDTRYNKYSTPYNTEIPLETDVVGCGNIHFPPNAQKHYDFSNTGEVQSDCSGQVETITCSIWGCNQEGFMKWWFNKIPADWWGDFLRK